MVADQAFSNLTPDATDEELEGLSAIEDAYWALYYKDNVPDLDRINGKVAAFVVSGMTREAWNEVGTGK